jgi:diaminopimelate epimerase
MTEFFKLSGSGNDFLALVEPAAPPAPELIRAWCRRGVSLGADGLFTIRREESEGNDSAGIAMDYWNADGLPAELCLNGTRCAAALAFHLGWAEDDLTVRTGAGPIPAHRLDSTRVALELPAPGAPAPATVELNGTPHVGYVISIGVPHFVLLWPETLATAPVVELGRPLRRHADFQPAGSNVDFIRFPAPDRMEIRTYERGVEDETLSCGTGVLAGAAVGVATGRATLPLTALPRSGYPLAVGGGAGGRLSLAGDARLVAHGELLPAAEL